MEDIRTVITLQRYYIVSLKSYFFKQMTYVLYYGIEVWLGGCAFCDTTIAVTMVTFVSYSYNINTLIANDEM